MNKRIKELLSEAKIYDGSGSKTEGITTCASSLEEFAKLIVKECCDMFIELRRAPAYLAALDVKKHFGVEE